jgi:hypothetical protein
MMLRIKILGHVHANKEMSCFRNCEANNQLCGAEHSSRGHQLCNHSIVSRHFIEPESSLPRVQELSTRTYPEPDQSTISAPSYLYKIYHNIIHPPMS